MIGLANSKAADQSWAVRAGGQCLCYLHFPKMSFVTNVSTTKIQVMNIHHLTEQNRTEQNTTLLNKYRAPAWENQRFAYAKTKTQISFVVTAKLIRTFVFATWIVQYLFFLNTKFQASSYLQWLYSLVCVWPGQKTNCWFSHAGAQIISVHSQVEYERS